MELVSLLALTWNLAAVPREHEQVGGISESEGSISLWLGFIRKVLAHAFNAMFLQERIKNCCVGKSALFHLL